MSDHAVLSVSCPFCGASAGARCVKGEREEYDVRRSHSARFDALRGDVVVMCKNACGRACPPPNGPRARRLFCSEECRRSYWSTPPADRPLVRS